MRTMKKGMKSIVCVMAMAMAVCFMPVATKAVTELPAPKDASQTAAQEQGVKVSWKNVTGAKSYVYSFSKDGKTYTQESPTGNGGIDTYVVIMNNTLTAGTDYYVKIRAFDGSKYSQAVVVKTATAPLKPTSIKQTEAEPTTVTVSWAASAGATGYLVNFGTSETTAKNYGTVTNTTCKLTGLKPDTQYYIAIYPVRKASASYSAYYDKISCYKLVTTASAVKNLKLNEWDVKTNQIELSWDNTAKFDSGYQLEIYSTDGSKLLKTYNIAGRRVKKTYFKNKKLANTPFRYRMRSYTTFSGKKSFGEWSAMKYAVPQGKVTATKNSDTSIKLAWDKVTGAKNYTIYMGTTDGGKFKTLKTVSKTSYVIKNLKTDQDYFFYVKANKVSMAGKKYNSTKVETTNDINVYISKYLDAVTE